MGLWRPVQDGGSRRRSAKPKAATAIRARRTVRSGRAARWRSTSSRAGARRGAGGLVFLSAANSRPNISAPISIRCFRTARCWCCRAGILCPMTRPGRRATSWGGARRCCGGSRGGLEPPLLIATPEAVLQRVPPREFWKDAALRVAPGTAVAEIEAFLRRTGYGLDMLVDEPGEAAVHRACHRHLPGRRARPGAHRARGRQGHPHRQLRPGKPAHLGRTAGNRARRGLRIRDPGRAGADGECARHRRAASRSLSTHYPKLDTLFDYLPGATVLIEDRSVERRAALWFEQIREAYESARPLPAAAEIGGGAGPRAPLPVRGGMGRGALPGGAGRHGAFRGACAAVRDGAQSGERLSRFYRRAARGRDGASCLRRPENAILQLAGPARRSNAAAERPRPVSGWDQVLDAQWRRHTAVARRFRCRLRAAGRTRSR